LIKNLKDFYKRCAKTCGALVALCEQQYHFPFATGSVMYNKKENL